MSQQTLARCSTPRTSSRRPRGSDAHRPGPHGPLTRRVGVPAPPLLDHRVRCVWVLAATGLINAAVRLGGIAPLVTTGYGAWSSRRSSRWPGLLAAGWWLRRTWLGPAAAHRIDADASLRRAVGESATMAVAFGLAAALATTA